MQLQRRKKRADPVIQRKKRRTRPGTVALREIRKYQKSTKLVIPYVYIYFVLNKFKHQNIDINVLCKTVARVFNASFVKSPRSQSDTCLIPASAMESFVGQQRE